MSTLGDVVVAAVQGGGDCGGVKNSSSLEVSWTGPMTSGHLQNHFQTAELTRVTFRGAMLGERDAQETLIYNMSKRERRGRAA